MMDLTAQDIEGVESLMLNEPQVECPVIHHFGDGLYIREINIPAGTISIGHRQKLNHLNIFLEGKVAMIIDGGVIEMEAPQMVFGTPGRKMGYIIDDCKWLNVYSTTETDIEKLEEMLFDKSDSWKEKEEDNQKIRIDLREEDREDFELFVKEQGFSKEDIRAVSVNMDDYREIEIDKVCVRASEIEGKGVFATYPIKEGEIIGPARIGANRTQLGKYVNHSKNPNSFFKKANNDLFILVSNQQIYGCISGGKGDELTVDYRESLKVNRG